MLVDPNMHAQLSIVFDAPSMAIGAVLHQKDGNDWKPLRFSSEALTQAQQFYYFHAGRFLEPWGHKAGPPG